MPCAHAARAAAFSPINDWRPASLPTSQTSGPLRTVLAETGQPSEARFRDTITLWYTTQVVDCPPQQQRVNKGHCTAALPTQDAHPGQRPPRAHATKLGRRLPRRRKTPCAPTTSMNHIVGLFLGRRPGQTDHLPQGQKFRKPATTTPTCSSQYTTATICTMSCVTAS